MQLGDGGIFCLHLRGSTNIAARGMCTWLEFKKSITWKRLLATVDALVGTEVAYSSDTLLLRVPVSLIPDSPHKSQNSRRRLLALPSTVVLLYPLGVSIT